MKGLRNLARDLHSLGVRSGEMKAMFKKQSSGVHVQNRLEWGRGGGLKSGRFPARLMF